MAQNDVKVVDEAAEQKYIDELVSKVSQAQKKFAEYSQEQVDYIFRRVALKMSSLRIPLAKMAVEETGMGVVEDKVIKNHFAAEYIYNKFKNTKTCGILEEDKDNGLIKMAEPLGVIAGVVPTTNPTSTAIFKTLIALKTRNGIIFSPHPRAKKSTVEAARIMLEEAVKAGAPENIIGWIDEPSILRTQYLMQHPKVDIILATGGPGMVKSAYSSGKPALGVGAGNTPAVIDETADIQMAVSSILMSKTFDNGMICASEQSVIAVKDVYDAVKAEFLKRGAYILTAAEKEKLGKVIMIDGKLNAGIVGQKAATIANMAGIKVAPETKVLIAEVAKVGKEEPFSAEKLSPVLAMYKAPDFESAAKLAKDLVTFGGNGHTSVLYTDQSKDFKDYISVPKANMYQSLHTTVVGGRRIPFPFEIQIRTWEMHRVAEYGIAAHWNYKEGAHGDGGLDQKLYWLRQILDWQSETRDSHEFIDSLKTDLFSEEVFLFTPKGDIISMQRGATPLDFAYRIHSQVGNTCVGAKINGKMVPLDTQLSTGDRVEIITSGASKGPSMDWLKIVKTQQAKAKIRQFLKKELRGENVQKGRDMLEHEAKRRGVKLGDYTKPEYYEPLLRKYMFQDLEDIYGAVGYGGVASAYVLSRLIDEKQKREAPVLPKVTVVQDGAAPAPTPQPPKGKPTHGIYVHGESGMLVRFAKCCNPVPGDDIVGYITRGRGVTVHKADCVNALHTEPERAIPVSWADEGAGTFSANLQMICYDHPSLLGEISAFISEMNLPLTAISVKLNKNKTCNITSTIQVQSREQLDNAIRKLQKRSDVIEAYRSVN